MKITPLKLIVAALVMATVLLIVVVVGATRTTGGSLELVISDSSLTVVTVGKLAGYRLYRVDDHGRRVTCYIITLGGVDCDRSFYERR